MIGKAIAAALVPLVGLLGTVALVAAVIGSLNPFNSTHNTDTPGMPGAPGGSGGAPSAQALADIPTNYLALYQGSAGVCPGLHWSILAGIGKVESNHGRSNLPGVHSGQNSAGAKGPMQFLQSTFNTVTARHPLSGNGRLIAPSPYDPSDAIHAAAYLLCDNGARNNRDIYAAIFNYNHEPNYVTRVLEIAHQYATTPDTPDQPGQPEPDGAPPQAQPAPAPGDPRVAPSATGALIAPAQLAAHPLAATLGHRGPATSNPDHPRPGTAIHGPVSPLSAASPSASATPRDRCIPPYSTERDKPMHVQTGHTQPGSHGPGLHSDALQAWGSCTRRPPGAGPGHAAPRRPRLDQPAQAGARFAEPPRSGRARIYGGQS